MGRRLSQAELLTLFDQAADQLRERTKVLLPSVVELGEDAYLEQMSQRQLAWGRAKGVFEAWKVVAEQAQWGPVHQARAHDAIVNRIDEVWSERAQALAQQARTAGYETHVRETLDIPTNSVYANERQRAVLHMPARGQLDALRAASAAIAGFPERLQALGELEHPERARESVRGRKQDRGRGLD